MPVDAFLQWCRQQRLARSTIYQRRRALVRLAAVLGDVPLIEATREQLEEWHGALAGRVGDDALYAYVSHVRAFYRWAADHGLIDQDPAARLPLPPIGRRLPRPIDETALLLAVTTAPERILPWLALAAWAGLRAKEIALLRRQHVLESWEQPSIRIVKQATKGGRRATERIVPMAPYVADVLVPVLPPAGWVFRRRDGQPGPNEPWLISRLANEHLHELGIAHTLHSLRHRFGTGLYQETQDILLVRDLLGHADVKTALGYAAYNNANAAAAVAALPAPGRLRAVEAAE